MDPGDLPTFEPLGYVALDVFSETHSLALYRDGVRILMVRATSNMDFIVVLSADEVPHIAGEVAISYDPDADTLRLIFGATGVKGADPGAFAVRMDTVDAVMGANGGGTL